MTAARPSPHSCGQRRHAAWDGRNRQTAHPPAMPHTAPPPPRALHISVSRGILWTGARLVVVPPASGATTVGANSGWRQARVRAHVAGGPLPCPTCTRMPQPACSHHASHNGFRRHHHVWWCAGRTQAQWRRARHTRLHAPVQLSSVCARLRATPHTPRCVCVRAGHTSREPPCNGKHVCTARSTSRLRTGAAPPRTPVTTPRRQASVACHGASAHPTTRWHTTQPRATPPRHTTSPQHGNRGRHNRTARLAAQPGAPPHNAGRALQHPQPHNTAWPHDPAPVMAWHGAAVPPPLFCCGLRRGRWCGATASVLAFACGAAAVVQWQRQPLRAQVAIDESCRCARHEATAPLRLCAHGESLQCQLRRAVICSQRTCRGRCARSVSRS